MRNFLFLVLVSLLGVIISFFTNHPGAGIILTTVVVCWIQMRRM